MNVSAAVEGTGGIASATVSGSDSAVGPAGGAADDSYACYREVWRESQPADEAIKLTAQQAAFTGDAGLTDEYGKQALYTNNDSTISWMFDVPSDARYALKIRYYPVEGKGGEIERTLRLDGELPFREAEYLTFQRVWGDDVSGDGFDTDYHGNHIKPQQAEIRQWITTTVRDPSGYVAEGIELYLTAGTHTLSLQFVKEPFVVDFILLDVIESLESYEQVLERYKSLGYEPSEEILTLEGESADERSDRSVYPLNDRSSAYTSPQDPSRLLLNTIGGDRWQKAGQWVRWKVHPKKAGLYRIGIRFRQNIVSGSFSGRSVRINGEIPFAQAEAFQFAYSGNWQKIMLGPDGGYWFYLPAEEITIELEVVLANNLSSILSRVETHLATLNRIYRSVLMITGAVPDVNRDYDFDKLLPDEIQEMASLAKEFEKIEAEYVAFVGQRGEMSAILNKLAFQLDLMSRKPKKIAMNMETFKGNLGSLGTWLLTAKQQPLEIDYIELLGKEDPAFSKKESGWREFCFGVQSFILSFFQDYEVVSGKVGGEGPALTAWLVSGRDQAQIIRQMIDDTFLPETGIAMNLQLVSAGTLLPAVLAGTGPDLSLSNASTDPVNYAIRGAVMDLSGFDGFDEVAGRFHPSAMVPLSFGGKTYALPETQSFPMLFYRTDIFEELGLRPPDTWEDFYKLIPRLQKNNMEIGFPGGLINTGISGLSIFLYQNGETMYRGDGQEVNLDSNASLDAFRQMCELFTKYKFPIEFDFANRFRTGEMPMAIQDYTLYNQLTVFAPEIKGQWDFIPVPGTRKADGTIDRSVPTGGLATIMLKNAEFPDNAWRFMEWWCREDTQGRFAQELESVMGQAAKYASANLEAFRKMSWSKHNYDNIMEQWAFAVGTPEVPGGYYTSRCIDFAFNRVYNTSANPVETMLDYIDDINAELTRKRREFGLTD